MSSDVAIRVSNLSKCYQIYDNPRDRLKQFFLPRLCGSVGQSPRNYYREFWALKDVSFEVKRGETVGIIGRNGSGKSTLLQLICGTLTPTAGEVQINGRVAALLELGAGFNPEFTGRENVYMSASILGMTKDEIDGRFDDIADFADIREFIEQPVKTYSSGMYVRLAFAVIAHVDADILVIDEALAVGDVFFTQKCMRFLRKFREEGVVLFVSHDMTSVMNLCHHSIWLESGTVRMTGSGKEVCESYLESVFEAKQGSSFKRDITISKDIVKDNKQDDANKKNKISKTSRVKDMRLDLINNSPYRNDIQIVEFKEDSPSFGTGSARIIDICLLNEKEERLSWVVGGEMVKLLIIAQALESIENVIIGFLFKDRLGQTLFSDNTYLMFKDMPVSIKNGEMIEVSFFFQMPILPCGDYSVTVAFAEGTQEDHIQHHWVHDALVVKSQSSSVCTGLIGLPMHDINLRKI